MTTPKEEGASSSLAPPPPWKKEFSKKQNRVYFFNPETNQSVWALEDIGKVAELTSTTTSSNAAIPTSTAATTSDAELPPPKRQRTQDPEGLRVAIIVPFRDLHVEQKRSAHLREFAPYMDEFLGRKCSPLVASHKIFVIKQSNDGHKFNRGKLLNVGFNIAAKQGYNSFIFHDVDLLPSEALVKYYAAYPAKPMHIARCWDRYNKNDKYLGGIVAFSREDFELIDGFPNIYWGWGGEDDELQKRVDESGIEVVGPPRNIPNAIRDLEDMSLDEKLQLLRDNKSWKCVSLISIIQKSIKRSRDDDEGLTHDCKCCIECKMGGKRRTRRNQERGRGEAEMVGSQKPGFRCFKRGNRSDEDQEL